MADEASASRSQRLTRSQAAPEWTAVEELVLANEIAAVEADCQKNLSTFQKWKIVAQNCVAQDVARSLSQYRRKWESLREDCLRIADFESESGNGASYWSLESYRRERLGLPMEFDRELYEVIRSILGARGSQPESEPEDDAGAMDDDHDVVRVGRDLGADTFASPNTHFYKHAKGSRKKRQRLSSREKCSWKSPAEDYLSECSTEPMFLKTSSAEEKTPQPLESPSENVPTENPTTEEDPTSKNNPAGTELEEPHQGSNENQPQADNAEEEVAVDEEARERMIARILRENAKRINCIVAEDALNIKSSEDEQLEPDELVRRRGTELVSCLGVICKTLDQLCNLAQGC